MDRTIKVCLLLVLVCLVFELPSPPTALATRKLVALVNEPPLVLKYHNGRLLKGDVNFNIVWYGKFTPSQRSILLDFVQSLSMPSPSRAAPSVSSWWRTTEEYKGGPINLLLGKQLFDDDCSLGKTLTSRDLARLARRAAAAAGGSSAISAVFTARDVAVEGFCMSRCSTHGSAKGGGAGTRRAAYLWVGNSETQCPGQCAWPFHQPVYGPQGPPLVAPNGDVGVDGMVISLATALAGAVTNPFEDGYYQGPAEAPLEAVTACTGVFGSGAYPGYPGKVLVERATGGSYNAGGMNGRKYLLPAMWDPKTSVCSTLL